MKKKKDNLFLIKILKKISSKIGAKVIIEPEWGVVAQVVFKNGKKRYSRGNCIDLNSLGASEIAKDKGYANFFMEKMGYSTIKGRTFYSDKWAEAIGSKDKIDRAFKYAEGLGFPVIVKPNSGSQGTGVAKVYDRVAFYKALRNVFKTDKIALVQEYIRGRDYRIVVLDDRIISAYERIPLCVIGDGRSSIAVLLSKKKRYFNKIKRDIKIDINDRRIKDKLKIEGLTLSSVLPKMQIVYLLDNANLSTGGDSVDVTNSIHKDFKKLAIRLTKDMGLRLCGVDLMVEGDIREKMNKYHIIEINAAPGLDHYVTVGKAQERIVEDLYLEVLKSMER